MYVYYVLLLSTLLLILWLAQVRAHILVWALRGRRTLSFFSAAEGESQSVALLNSMSQALNIFQGAFRFGPFEIGKVWYFGIDTVCLCTLGITRGGYLIRHRGVFNPPNALPCGKHLFRVNSEWTRTCPPSENCFSQTPGSAVVLPKMSGIGFLRFRRNHLSNTTCLTHVFFKSGEMKQTQLAILDK